MSSKDPEERQVLRYWLAAVRQEESIAGRPRPHKPIAKSAVKRRPNLIEPGPGQAYFRVGADQAAFLIGKTKSIALPLDDDPKTLFFERWLRTLYREQARAARTRGAPHPQSFVAGWPTVHLEQKDELATLFRFPVELNFRTAGQAFVPPSYEDRRSGRAPAPPDEIVVHGSLAGTNEPGPPFAVDLQLLSWTLGVQEEAIDDLAARWAKEPPLAHRMLEDVLALLDPEARPKDRPAEAMFEMIAGAARRRAPEDGKVYATAIIQDGSLLQTTFHLQREIEDLLREGVRDRRSALHAYLSGTAVEVGARDLKGRIHARGLTKSQLDAAEHALGTTLAAVRGPPGTGKTELILNLAAHAIVERAESLLNRKPIGTEVLVVASTNNRAVDNAIDPLARDLSADRLPLALRCGNREVTASTTREQFLRALEWLEAHDSKEPLASLSAALDAFKRQRKAWARQVKPNRKRRDKAEALAKAKASLRALEPLESASPLGQGLDPERIAALERLAENIDGMISVFEERGSKKLARIERFWKHFAKGPLARARSLGLEAAERISERMPPQAAGLTRDRHLSIWKTELEAAGAMVEEALGPIEALRRIERDKEERAELEAEILSLEAELGALEAEQIDAERREALAHALFLGAVEVRERWAVLNRAALTGALEKAVEAAEQRSLRRFLEKDRKAAALIEALYPVLGCTLLSLGNVFSAAPEAIGRLVIDEGGQCHPAAAVSGLVRARRVLVIGDVHQLTPVIELSELDERRARRSARLTVDPERFERFRVHDKSTASAQSLADRADPEHHTLIDHFRCQPEIIAVSDALCGYGLVVHTPRRSFEDRVPWLSAPLLLEDVRGAQYPFRGSWANREEAERTLRFVLDLLQRGIEAEAIAVLTPYVGQLELLRSLFHSNRIDETVALGTVHRFQGGERDVAILTTAISEPRSLGFLNERPNLLNVAVSRARVHFVLIGHVPVLRRGQRTELLVNRAVSIGPS